MYYSIKVRGHAMFWGVKGHSPQWVEELSADELRATIDERIDFMTNIALGK